MYWIKNKNKMFFNQKLIFKKNKMCKVIPKMLRLPKFMRLFCRYFINFRGLVLPLFMVRIWLSKLYILY